MEGIKIEAGCVRIPRTENGWNYQFRFQGPNGYEDSYLVSLDFVADPGDKPEIGDFIVGGRLVKRKAYQINQDKRKWEERFTDTLARDKMQDPYTWPGLK